MNLKVFLTIALFMLGAGVALTAQEKKTVTDKEKVTFWVSMTCENCEKRIENNLAFEKGVTDIKINLPNQLVEVEFKTKQTSAQKIQAAIEKLGYEVKIYTVEEEKEEKIE